jgi:hypothetical protein
MATWRAEVFVNSQVGRITTEVEAATASGAQQQIYAKHGNVQQIVNLRQVSSGGGGSSFSAGDTEGLVWLLGIGFVLYLLVTYWYIAIPVGIVLGILVFMGMSGD